MITLPLFNYYYGISAFANMKRYRFQHASIWNIAQHYHAHVHTQTTHTYTEIIFNTHINLPPTSYNQIYSFAHYLVAIL